MSSNTTLARPYARAAFETARAANDLAGWSDRLAFAVQVANDPQVAPLVGNPRVSAEQLAQLFTPPGVDAGSPFASFVSMLAANRRMTLLPEIAELYAEAKRDHDQVLHVTVRAAVPVEREQADKLVAALSNRFKRRIELSSVIDESVIGGAVIDAGDVVIDASVRGRLARLQQSLAR